MAFIPSSERSGVHDDDGILDQRLRPNKLVVGGIVNYIDNASLSRTVCKKSTKCNNQQSNVNQCIYPY